MFCLPCISIHLCNENQLDALLSSAYFVNQPVHVSGIFVARHQELYCIYTCCAVQLTVCWPANRQSIEQHKKYKLLYIYSIPPDDGLQIWPKHVEVDWRNKLRINSASSWFYLTDTVRKLFWLQKRVFLHCSFKIHHDIIESDFHSAEWMTSGTVFVFR